MIKRLIAILAVCCLAVAAFAQTSSPPVSLAVAYDVSADKFYPVTAVRMGRVQGLAFQGERVDLDVVALAGVEAEAGAPMLGFGITRDWKIAENLSLTLGGWARFQPGEKSSGGVIAGFSLRL